MSLAGSIIRSVRDTNIMKERDMPVKTGNTVYCGSIVQNDSGYITPADGSGKIMGVSAGYYEALESARVQYGHIEKFTLPGASKAYNGEYVYCSDDNTLTYTENDSVLGKQIDIVSNETNKIYVEVTLEDPPATTPTPVVPPVPIPVPGRYYDASNLMNPLVDTINQSFLIYTSNDEILAYHVYFPDDTEIDRMAFQCLTAQAGGIVHVGIYEIGNDGLPGDLLLDSGALGIDTTGAKEATVSYTIPKGWYFFAFAYNSTANGGSVRAFSITECNTTFGFSSNTSTSKEIFCYNSFTYSGALPDPFPISGIAYYSYNTPRIMVRIA